MVLLGVVDRKLSDSEDKLCDLYTNKIGGQTPSLFTTRSDLTLCSVCRTRQMALVVQIYVPLDDCDSHRTLFVFACLNKTCHSLESGWSCVRIQWRVDTCGVTPPVTDICSTTASSCMSPNFTQQWCDGSDMWDDDFNTDNKQQAVVAEHVTPVGAEITEQRESSTGSNVQTTDTYDVGVAEHIVSDIYSSMNMDNVCIQPDTALTPYYIDVVDECFDDCNYGYDQSVVNSNYGCNERVGNGNHYYNERVGNDNHGYKELVANGNHGNDKGDSVCDSVDWCRAVTSEASEQYERAQTKHGDRHMYRLKKCLSRCPQQVIRYTQRCERAAPLLLHDLPARWRPDPCGACGHMRVLEMQLMPTLVWHFAERLEFGTLCVYTCPNSCSQQTVGDTCVREQCVLQLETM